MQPLHSINLSHELGMQSTAGTKSSNFPENKLPKPRSACHLKRLTHLIPKYIHWTLRLNYMLDFLQNIPQADSEDIDQFHVKCLLCLLWKRNLSEHSL